MNLKINQGIELKKPTFKSAGMTSDKQAGFIFKYQGDRKLFDKVTSILNDFIEEEEIGENIEL